MANAQVEEKSEILLPRLRDQDDSIVGCMRWVGHLRNRVAGIVAAVCDRQFRLPDAVTALIEAPPTRHFTYEVTFKSCYAPD